MAAGAAAAGALAFGPGFWRAAFDAPAATAGAGPYGPLGPPDANGIMLPAGFRSRELARANVPVQGTTYPWHVFSDGQATYTTADGGWILVSNSESLAASGGGSSAIRFASNGSVTNAYRILGGTQANCAGGRTPWGTWLSCEEYDGGHVWEADPTGAAAAVVRPALGVFAHESVAVDPVGRRLYLTEDRGDGGFYRFTPSSYPDLSRGRLEVAVVSGGAVSWAAVPDPSAIGGPTRRQVPSMTRFDGGEGSWFDSGVVYFTTKGDDRVWAYDTAAARLDVIYDAAAVANAPLSGVDNVTVSSYGDVYVCEDGGNLELCLITPAREVAPFLRLTGAAHDGSAGTASELAGVIFDPSGTRLYFSSQRGYGLGVIYEVSGPFRNDPARIGAPLAGPVIAGPPRASTGSPGPAIAVADRDAPGLTLVARRRVRYRRLRRRGGLRVAVVVDEPGDVALSLTTADAGREPGKRGSTSRPVTLTLGRTGPRRVRQGRHKLKVRLRRRAMRKLRGRRTVLVRVTAQARDAAGNVAVATRRVRVVLRGS